MSEYLKPTLANLLQKVRSLQLSSFYRFNVPHVQIPAPSFQGKNNLPARNPKVFIAFAFVILLLFWKDIIQDVCSHVVTRRAPVAVVEVSPIRNNTLGVRLLAEWSCYCR